MHMSRKNRKTFVTICTVLNIEDNTVEREIGLFSINNGVIDNLKLVKSNIKCVNKDYAITGSIAESNYGIITNCTNSRKGTRS